MLEAPKVGYMQRGGKAGVHSESMGRLLAEMQVLQRTYPDMVW
jgi:ring-1,2-phenylacetyl-CoA epoxidase subunit PaaC